MVPIPSLAHGEKEPMTNIIARGAALSMATVLAVLWLVSERWSAALQWRYVGERSREADELRGPAAPAVLGTVLAITAAGGAWNASIVAEYTQFGGQTFKTIGIGSAIAQSAAAGDYPLLLAATLTMLLTVGTINRLVWQRLYRMAESRYRME